MSSQCSQCARPTVATVACVLDGQGRRQAATRVRQMWAGSARCPARPVPDAGRLGPACKGCCSCSVNRRGACVHMHANKHGAFHLPRITCHMHACAAQPPPPAISRLGLKPYTTHDARTCRSSGERMRRARGVVAGATFASRLRSSSTATRMSSVSRPAEFQGREQGEMGAGQGGGAGMKSEASELLAAAGGAKAWSKTPALVQGGAQTGSTVAKQGGQVGGRCACNPAGTPLTMTTQRRQRHCKCVPASADFHATNCSR